MGERPLSLKNCKKLLPASQEKIHVEDFFPEDASLCTSTFEVNLIGELSAEDDPNCI
jgi:hypothetical protein